MGKFLREQYDGIIAPQLQVALQDCAAAPAILSRALGWARQVALLGEGIEKDFQAEINKTSRHTIKSRSNAGGAGRLQDRMDPSYGQVWCAVSISLLLFGPAAARGLPLSSSLPAHRLVPPAMT